MEFHLVIRFTNGSNSWVHYGMTALEYGKELVKWSENYELEMISAMQFQEGWFIHMKATEKQGGKKA